MTTICRKRSPNVGLIARAKYQNENGIWFTTTLASTVIFRLEACDIRHAKALWFLPRWIRFLGITDSAHHRDGYGMQFELHRHKGCQSKNDDACDKRLVPLHTVRKRGTNNS